MAMHADPGLRNTHAQASRLAQTRITAGDSAPFPRFRTGAAYLSFNLMK